MLRAGLGAAVRYAVALGLDTIQHRAWALAEALRERLAAMPGAIVHDLGREKSAIVSFTIDGLEPDRVVAALREQAIHIGSSAASSTRLDAEARRLPTLLRAAPHYYNTDGELERLMDALSALRGTGAASTLMER